MSANKKPIRPSAELNIQSWQLPDLHGPKVHEYDALGNRSDRDARMYRARHPEAPADEADAVDQQAGTDAESEPEFDPPTAAELQALRAAACEEGFAEGRQAGYDEGYASGQEEGLQAGREAGEQAGHATGMEKAEAEAATALVAEKQALARQLGEAIAQLNQREQALEDEFSPIARDLILRLTQGLLGQSLEQSPEQIEDIVHQAIELMPAAHERMEIFLHPDSASLLGSLDLHWLQNVDVRTDEALSPGGCRVKTRHSLLDYTLDQRYQVQIQALLDNEITAPDSALRTFSRERFNELLEWSGKAQEERDAAELTDPVTDDDNAEPSAEAAHAEPEAESDLDADPEAGANEAATGTPADHNPEDSSSDPKGNAVNSDTDTVDPEGTDDEADDVQPQ